MNIENNNKCVLCVCFENLLQNDTKGQVTGSFGVYIYIHNVKHTHISNKYSVQVNECNNIIITIEEKDTTDKRRLLLLEANNRICLRYKRLRKTPFVTVNICSLSDNKFNLFLKLYKRIRIDHLFCLFIRIRSKG